MRESEVYPDAASLAQAAAKQFTVLAAQAIDERGCFFVALAGGSTPRATYALLATRTYVARVHWPKVHVFWGDERCVPPDHPDSNYKMAHEALLDKAKLPPGNVHRIRGELPPEQATLAYREELEAALGTGGRLDLILLGMGADGHTASLFPGSPAVEEQEQMVVAAYVERLHAWRVTLTLPAINAARHVVFLVSGDTKAPALARVRAGESLPAALVRPSPGQLTWMVDQDVARSLSQEREG